MESERSDLKMYTSHLYSELSIKSPRMYLNTKCEQDLIVALKFDQVLTHLMVKLQCRESDCTRQDA